MQFKVPQNIDQEDKILGPLTFVQFIYVLIGGGLVLLAYSIFDFTLFLIIAIPVVIFTVAFALVRVQDQPFSRFFLSLLIFLRLPKRRVWQDAEPAENKELADDFFTKPAVKGKDKKAKAQSPVPAVPISTKPAKRVPISVQSGGGA